MKALAIATATFVALGIASAAHAQQRSARDMMNDMKAKYGQTFDQCQTLAASRGYRFQEAGEGSDNRAVMMFIEGCIMGQQR
jgi:mannose/cellobiose epimerase-like protein (N-acyl-D-glucosamine 2-epimerase family)